MKKTKWVIQIIAFFCLSYSPQLIAQDSLQLEEKIYVSSDRIQMTPHGIFYMNEIGDLQPVRTVSFDEGGIFISAYTQCPFCGAWSSDKTIVHKPGCPMNAR